MGDRSNVFIQMDRYDDGWRGIGFYSHWGGLDMHIVAVNAARESVERLGDPTYFARRMIQKILATEAEVNSATGAGLWISEPPDNEYPILVINALSGLAWLTDDRGYRLPAPDFAIHINDYEFADSDF